MEFNLPLKATNCSLIILKPQQKYNAQGSTQGCILSLFRLLARHTKGNKPLVDYSQSHAVINSKYLDILRKKTMEKVVAK
jgi:hypothetical protein